MTTSTEWFLSSVNQAIREMGDLVPGIGRLLRLAERGYALEQALRRDPGHDITEAVVEPGQDRTKAVEAFVGMGRALLVSTGPFEPGVCRVCGCVENRACWIERTQGRPGYGTCAWADSSQTLCDNPECLAAAGSIGLVEIEETDVLELTEADRLWVPTPDGIAATASIACTDLARSTGVSTDILRRGSATAFSSAAPHYTTPSSTTEN